MRSVPFFLDTFPRSRRPDYSRLRGDARTRVAIVGGGLTGCACAASFASAGVDAILLEADRIGAAATAASPGLLRQDLDASFAASTALHGLRVARHVWQGFRRASLDFGAALRRFGIRADLAPQDLLLIARDAGRLSTAGSAKAGPLQREYQARRAADVDATWLTSRQVAAETSIASSGGIRTKGDVIDPYRAAVGLAAAAAARGADIHERTIVRRIRARRKFVEIKTDGGTITADAVVIATGALIDDLRALRRHFASVQSFMVVTERMPAAVRRELGRRAAALRDTASPPHLLRWLKEDRVLFGGADQAPIGPRLRDKALVQQANELMYELTTLYPAISGLQPEWAWDVVTHGSPDGLPVVGPHRNFPRHLFALGHGHHGAGMAWLAARVLLRAFLGEPAKGDEFFGFARIL
jgi:glycine/D-amino acid oxidase-like deaminating enzyme